MSQIKDRLQWPLRVRERGDATGSWYNMFKLLPDNKIILQFADCLNVGLFTALFVVWITLLNCDIRWSGISRYS